MRTMIAAAALVAFAGVANAQDAAPRGWARDIPEAQCTADKGLKWVKSDEITSKNTGKTRVTKARCAVDSKAAAAILYRMHAGR